MFFVLRFESTWRQKAAAKRVSTSSLLCQTSGSLLFPKSPPGDRLSPRFAFAQDPRWQHTRSPVIPPRAWAGAWWWRWVCWCVWAKEERLGLRVPA